METKQTAVEWLMTQYRIDPDSLITTLRISSKSIDIWNEALRIEKEQINTSYGVGFGDAIFYKKNKIMPPYDLNSTYYDITYGKETDLAEFGDHYNLLEFEVAKDKELIQLEAAFKAGWMRANATNYDPSYFEHFLSETYGNDNH